MQCSGREQGVEGGRAERGGEGGDGGGRGQELHDRQRATGDRQKATYKTLPDKTQQYYA